MATWIGSIEPSPGAWIGSLVGSGGGVPSSNLLFFNKDRMNHMLLSVKNGATSVILRCKILNSSVTTGAGLTGLAFDTSNLRISVIADNSGTPSVYTGANIEVISAAGTFQAPSTTSKCRFLEVDSTNHKGIYEIQFDNTKYTVSGARYLLVSISGPTNCAETDLIVPLVQLDPYTNRVNINGWFPKNTAFDNFEFDLVLASDGQTPATGKTGIGAQRSIDGNAFADCANKAAIAEIGSGTYKINLAQGDLNGNLIEFRFSESSCLTTVITLVTTP